MMYSDVFIHLTQQTLTYFEQELVLCDPLHWLEEVGIEGELVVQIPLHALEKGLNLSTLTQQCLRVGTTLAVHRVHLELTSLKRAGVETGIRQGYSNKREQSARDQRKTKFQRKGMRRDDDDLRMSYLATNRTKHSPILSGCS